MPTIVIIIIIILQMMMSRWVFLQSLDGKVRKWFIELPVNSISGIDALEETFMKQLGDTKDYWFYII